MALCIANRKAGYILYHTNHSSIVSAVNGGDNTRGFVSRYRNMSPRFGFIHPDIFVDSDALIPHPDRVTEHNPNGWLVEGDVVEYDYINTTKGKRAVWVKLITSNV